MHGIKQTPDDATFSSINARNKKITTFSFRQDFPLSQKVRLQWACGKRLSAFQKEKENLWIQLPFLWLRILQSINL